MPTNILPELFNRSLSLESGGDRSGKDPIALWERMAKRLDEIAANTRRGMSAGMGTGSRTPRTTPAQGARQRNSARYSDTESSVGGRSAASTGAGRRKARTGGKAGGSYASRSSTGRVRDREPHVRAASGSGVRGLGPTLARAATQAATAASTQAVIRAKAAPRDAKGRFTSDKAKSDAIEKLKERKDQERREKTFFDRLKEAYGEAKGGGKGEHRGLDAIGVALGGPFYEAAKELFSFGNDVAGKDSFMGRMVTSFIKGNQPEEQKNTTAEDDRKEDKAQAAQNRLQQRTNRESSARDTESLEIAADSLDLQRDQARQDHKRHKELVKAVRSVRPSLLGRALAGRLMGGRMAGRVVGGAAGAKAGRVAARGGLMAGAGGLLRGAGSMLRVLGPAAALLFAGMDAVEGWNNKELQQKAFGLKEGQEATTGQKVSAAAANVLDMGGLLTGAANFFGFDIDTADIARGLYNTASAIGDFYKNLWGTLLNPEKLLAGAKTLVANAVDLGKRAFDGVTDFVSGLDLPGKASALVGAAGALVGRAVDGIGEFFGGMDITGTISGAATAAWGAISSFGSKIGEAVSSFFGDIDIVGTLKEAASGAWGAVKGGAGKIADGFMSLFSDDGDKTPAKEVKQASEKKLAQEVAQKAGKTTGVSAPVASVGSEESLPVEISPSDIQAMSAPLVANNEATTALTETYEDLIAILTKDYQLREREYRLNMMLNPEAAAMLGLTDALKGFSFGGGGSYGGGGGGGGGSYTVPGVKFDPNAKLGSYFAKYESGDKGVDAIGYDTGGGTSYGKYQFSSVTGGMEDLLTYMEKQGGEAAEAARRIRAAGPLNTGSKNGAAVDAYNAEVARNREMMERVQDEFAYKNYYVSALSGLDGDFQQRIEGNRALQEVLFSSSIQHGQGGARGIFKKALEQNPNATDEELISAIFQIRSGYLGKLNAGEKSGVLNRYRDEEAMAIQLSRSQKRTEAFQRAAASGGQTALDAQVSFGIQDLTEDAIRRGVKYQLGGKNSYSGEGIDCSGWIYEANTRMMEAINDAAGEIVYDDSAFRALRAGHNSQGAAGLVKAVYDRTGEMLTNETLNADTVKAGMFLGLDTGKKKWDGGRFLGIDHIAQTFRDEATGQMMVSESRGDRGVMISTFEEWEKRYKGRGAKIFAVDPTQLADASKIQATAAAEEAAQAAVAEATEVQAESVQAQTAQAIAMERAEVAAPVPRTEEVGQIAPPMQSGTNRQLDLAKVEGLLTDILKALQSGFTKMQRPVEMAGGAGPNFAMDFDDAAARDVANS